MENNRILVMAGIGFALLMLFFGWCYSKKSPRVEKMGLEDEWYWYQTPVPFLLLD